MKSLFSSSCRKPIRTLPVLAILLACLFSGGCATYGNKQLSSPARMEFAREGVHRKRDVHALIGQPHDVMTFSGGGALWEYHNAEVAIPGKEYIPFYGLFSSDDMRIKSTVAFFEFDSGGVLLKRRTEQKQYYVSSFDTMKGSLQGARVRAISERVRAEMAGLGLPFDSKTAKQMGDLLAVQK